MVRLMNLMHKLLAHDLGRAPYAPTLELQLELVERLKADDEGPDHLILVEHDPPVITLGRGAKKTHLLASPEALQARGFEVHETSRGGDVTYHGPGQIVGYPIIRVARHGKDVHQFIRNIEETLIRLLGRYGVEANRVKGLTGVWVGDEKIAAIGVALTRWISHHGFALNVSTDLTHFQTITPCGITDKGVTSLSALLGRPVSPEEVKPLLVECFSEVFGYEAAYE